MLKHLSNNRGYTIIEFVIIISILGILAAVAIPKYQGISTTARVVDAYTALGSMRMNTIIYCANEAVQTGIATWPELNSLATFMERDIPKNPYQASDCAPDSIVTGVDKGVVVDTRDGWAYKASTGEIWLNTNTVGENSW